jgi:spore maturation protein CgeB
MRLLLVGDKWMGGWMEGVESAARALNHTTLSFYIHYPKAYDIAGMRKRVNRYVPSMLRRYIMPSAEYVGGLWEAQRSQQLISVCSSFRPDIILILKGETIQPHTLSALRASGRKIVSWWLDDPLQYKNVVPQLEFLDVLFVYDRGRFSELAGLGAPTLVYLPCAFDPTVYHPQVVEPALNKSLDCTIAFIGSYYPARGALLQQLYGLDVRVGVWGYDWANATEIKSFPDGTWRGAGLLSLDAAKVYNLAKICPNLHHSQTCLGGLNLRTFEIPAAGGFELVDHVNGIEDLFEIGREMITYRSPEHFRELVDYYLASPEKRGAIAEQGRIRVLRDHTYEQRLLTMLDVLG